VTIKDRIPEEAYVLDEAEVDAIRYIKATDLESAYRRSDPGFVPADMESNVRSSLPLHAQPLPTNVLMSEGSCAVRMHSSEACAPADHTSPSYTTCDSAYYHDTCERVSWEVATWQVVNHCHCR
jgi:hypothetical protein